MTFRVAVVHSFYESSQPSGENAQVRAEVALMERAGFEVRLFAVHTDEVRSNRFYSLRSGARVATGLGCSPLVEIDAFAPDVVHIHNLFPNIARRWVRRLKAPTVVTLHNFRFGCAKASLFRDGTLCTDCPDGDRWAGVRHRCYRGSALASLPLAIAQHGGVSADPVLASADRILCLSRRQRQMLLTGGIPSGALTDWTNFLPREHEPDPPPASPSRPREGCLFVGRLSEEKGALDLVRTWDDRMVLRVVGDGPLLAEVRRAAEGRRVEVLGLVPRSSVLDLMAESAVFAMPGGWPEVAPLVHLEALASGLPVVVRRVCGISAAIEGQRTGVVVDTVSQMPRAAASAAADTALPARCRAAYEADYTEHSWLGRLSALYSSMVAGPAGRDVPIDPTRRETA